MGIGSITFSLPHFFSGRYHVDNELNTTTANICKPPSGSQTGTAADVFLDTIFETAGVDKIFDSSKGEQFTVLFFVINQLCDGGAKKFKLNGTKTQRRTY